MKKSKTAKKPQVVKSPIGATVLISDARSGTNFLISKIFQTKKAIFGWEPFNDAAQKFVGYGRSEGLYIPTDVLARMNDKAFRDGDPEGYIDYCAGFTGALDGSDAKLTGFKIFPAHNIDIFWKMTKNPQFKPIILQRKSVLSVYSSLLIAYQTNQWVDETNGKTANDGQAKQSKVEFKKDDFEAFRMRYIGRFLQAEKNMQKHGVQYYKCFYEDLISDKNEIGRVLNFLGLDSSADEESWLKVQNSTNVLDRFENPEDVMPYLKREIAEIDGNLPEPGALTIHIGPPKTGSTSLQLALWKAKTPNVTYLGTFQPRSKNKPKGILMRLDACSKATASDDFLSILLCSLDTHLKHGADLVLSEEMFLVDQPSARFGQKLKALNEVCKQFSPTVVITLREPVSALKSLYNEIYVNQAKTPKIEFSDFLKSNQAKVYDYMELISLLNMHGFTDLRGISFDSFQRPVLLSAITGNEKHTEVLDMPIVNVTRSNASKDLVVPDDVAQKLAKSYEAALVKLNLEPVSRA